MTGNSGANYRRGRHLRPRPPQTHVPPAGSAPPWLPDRSRREHLAERAEEPPLGSAATATCFHAEPRRTSARAGHSATCFHAEARRRGELRQQRQRLTLRTSLTSARISAPQRQRAFDVDGEVSCAGARISTRNARPRHALLAPRGSSPRLRQFSASPRGNHWASGRPERQFSAAPRLRVEPRCASGQPERHFSALSARCAPP